MSRLSELQQAFQQCLLKTPDDPAQPWISNGGRATPARQLSAYRHAYPARLKETLAGDYPAVLMAIGEEGFERLAQAYIDTHPSRFFSLREFGGRLAGFIAGHDDYRALPWLAELARFEWALGLAFDAGDATPASIGEMAALAPSDWHGLHFRAHPSVQRLDLAWNTPAIWSALTADEPDAVTARKENTVGWLIWREQLITRFRSLSADEQCALDCLLQGGSFGAVCEQLLGFHPEGAVPMRAAGLLKSWLSEGLICR